MSILTKERFFLMRIMVAKSNYEVEPLLHPFGFKGGALTSLWQYSVYLETACGLKATGIGNQNTLWSDAGLFAERGEDACARLMYQITLYAVEWLQNLEFENPQQCFDILYEKAMAFAKKLTNYPHLRPTFVLNALVGVDHALWKLYEQATGHHGFDAIVPHGAKLALTHRYNRISVVPLISYGVSLEEVRTLALAGHFLLKIKIGSDPNRDGDRDAMLAWDKRRILEVHQAVKDIQTPYTTSSHIAYYLDANGRYDTKERLAELLSYADAIGALSRTVIVEEPFAEENKCYVGDLPALIAADESAHSPADVAERIALGYGAIALKPIAKTMTVTFRMIEEAYRHHIPCFCADLTVGPLLLEMNKSFAARLSCLPGLTLPVVESNGWQNYARWEQMADDNPVRQQRWAHLCDGGYALDAGFYQQSGGMFMDYPRYRALAKHETDG